MGTNACWIQVETTSAVDRERLASAIEAYWTDRGAAVGPRGWRRLEPLALEEKRELAFALSEGIDGWVTVCDSERYTADFGLAQHLAKSLSVRVRFVGTWDASNHTIDRYLGRRGKRCGHEPSAYYDELADANEQNWLFLSIKYVDLKSYDPGPRRLAGGGKPVRPKKGKLGLASKRRDAYLVVETGASLETSAPIRAHGSMTAALLELAKGPDTAELRVLMGKIWYMNAPLWDDETGEPIAMDDSDDEVFVEGAECTDRFSRSNVLEAWLMSLLLVSSDVVQAERTVLSTKSDDFSGALSEWGGLRSTLAERALVECRRLETIPETQEPLPSLFRKAVDGDSSVCDVLEKVAFLERNFMAWRLHEP